ncbi:SDR family NAD(P)-dependent oxidoreductase [Nocardioides sambongensis]|uniref:SDR family NAD(P)-dependent oxidoreductase n=1 Tax=Nocardioides sambongensis TaxID=2589074 RepID=UPI00112B0E3F|nr:SDR family oxidoreductase [Nocardioides sambongensis]
MPDRTERLRTALVTGGAQGLGLSMAAALSDVGYRVCLSDLTDEALTESGRSLRTTRPQADVLTVACDVTDDGAVDMLMGKVRDWADGSLDVLVNNAGIIARSPTQDLDTETWARTLDVNLSGSFRCARAAHPLLRGGIAPTVINLGSLGSTLGMPQRAAYNAAKTGLVGLTRTLAAEWGPDGIRVNAVAPGFIETSMMRSGFQKGLLDEEQMKRRIPLRRLGEPAEISAAVLFLASPAASYVNGVVLPVDGGTVVDGTFF